MNFTVTSEIIPMLKKEVDVKHPPALLCRQNNTYPNITISDVRWESPNP